MDEALITFFGSFAAIMILLAITIGLGRKYHLEKIKKENTKNE